MTVKIGGCNSKFWGRFSPSPRPKISPENPSPSPTPTPGPKSSDPPTQSDNKMSAEVAHITLPPPRSESISSDQDILMEGMVFYEDLY